jgi:CRP-like cAMP-binding protein
MERRLSDSFFKSVPQRVASTLCTLAGQQPRHVLSPRGQVIAITHEQIAELAGTSRETATKVLGDFADRGMIRLGRGRITIVNGSELTAQAGDQ